MGQKVLIGLLLLTPLLAYPFLRRTVDPVVDQPRADTHHLPREEAMAFSCFSLLPGQSFPAVIPWGPLFDLSEQRLQKLEKKAKDAPIAFLEECLKKYEQEVHGYTVTFRKQENVSYVRQGKTFKTKGPKEKIKVHFREKPFSVFMNWQEGQGKAARTLYVEGENDGRLAARPLVFGVESPVLFDRSVDDPDARKSSRFPITEFGIYKGAKSTIDAIRAADAKGTLHLKYEGVVRVPELGNRQCFKFLRYPYNPPELDDINHLTFYIDTDTLLQIGSELRDSNMDLIANYFFLDVILNPTFDKDQFTRKKL